MDFIRSHKLIAATIAIQIVVLPIILLAVKQQQDTNIQAAQSTTLFFNPTTGNSTPLAKNPGESFSMDVMLNPGANLVSSAKIQINYDPTKVKLDPANPVTINTQSFPVTLGGPVVSESGTTGKFAIEVGIGANQTNVIQTETKVFTLNFISVASVNETQVTFNTGVGADNRPNTDIRSLAATDRGDENVLNISSLTPAYIKVNPAPTSTPTPTAVPPTNTPTPTLTPTPTNTPTPLPTATPTPTTAPNPTVGPAASTILNFTGLKLHGIGKGGDNPNPTSNGTMSPIRTTRNLTVEVSNSSGTLINTVSGNITYTGPTTGVFNGSITLPNTITSGDYFINIRTPYYLGRDITVFGLIAGQTNQITPVALVAGDANNDNTLSIADYNLIIDCYSDIAAAKNCNETKFVAADLSDDGKVNQDDYNLYLRELSVQSGD